MMQRFRQELEHNLDLCQAELKQLLKECGVDETGLIPSLLSTPDGPVAGPSSPVGSKLPHHKQ